MRRPFLDRPGEPARPDGLTDASSESSIPSQLTPPATTDELELELEPVDPKEFRRLLEEQRRTPPEPPLNLGAPLGERAAVPNRARVDPFAAPDEPPVKKEVPSSRSTEIAVPEPEVSEPEVSEAKLSEANREEVLHKLREGFQGLSSVLSGIDDRIAEHNRNSGELTDSVKELPEMMRELPTTSRAGVELLHRISEAIQSQGGVSRELVERVRELGEKVRDIPVALQRLGARLDQDGEDRERLDRSMQDVRRAVTDVQSETAQLHRTALQEFRKAMEAERLEIAAQRSSDQEVVRQIVERTGKQNQVLNVLMAVLILAFAAYLVRLAVV